MRVELVRKILNILPAPVSLLALGVKFYSINPKEINALIKRINNYKDDLKKQGLYDQKNRVFFRSLKYLCVFGYHIGAGEYIDSYFEGKPLKALKDINVSYTDKKPILICCVKDDLDRIKKVYDFHKSIGINKMVFVDNMSTDGTREWLYEKDVDLFEVDEIYHAGRKAAWIRKIQDIYGYNRWYLVVDSDELFTYLGHEEYQIDALVAYLEQNKMKRTRSVLLDMYPKGPLYKELGENDLIAVYKYFDLDSYYDAKDGRGYMVRGGPRKRVFEGGADHSEPLTKYPLFYAEYEDIWCDHRPIPFKKNFNTKCFSVLRHYKFVYGDYNKYLAIANEGHYYNGSANYRIYTRLGDDVTFWNDFSSEYIGSQSLKELPFMDDWK